MNEPEVSDDGPLHLIEDADTGDRFLVYPTEKGAQVELRVIGNSFWATQAQMAEIFGVNVPAISKHLKNIFDEGELMVNATVSKMERVAQEGGRRVVRFLDIYNLNALISVGYRIESRQGTLFRIWATDKLVQYLTKGFVIDDFRLKNPDGQPDFFDELLEKIRDIRSSEKRMWTRILELAAFCVDYDPSDESQHIKFFAEIQNTLHWAVSLQTAAEIVKDRVDATKTNAGVVTFKGHQPTVAEAQVAKNLMWEPEVTSLNHITSLIMEFFESQAEQRRPTTLIQFIAKMRELVKLDGRPLKQDGYAGRVSRDDANAHAADQIRRWKAVQRVLKEEAGEKALRQIAGVVKARRPRKKKNDP